MTHRRQHIKRQEEAASDLEGLPSALGHLNRAESFHEAQAVLIEAAHQRAVSLAASLATGNLPSESM